MMIPLKTEEVCMCCERGFMGDRERRFSGGLRLLLTEDFGEGEIKREREGGGGGGFLPSHGTDQTTAG